MVWFISCVSIKWRFILFRWGTQKDHVVHLTLRVFNCSCNWSELNKHSRFCCVSFVWLMVFLMSMLVFISCAGKGALDIIWAAQSFQSSQGQCHITVKRLRILWICRHQCNRSGKKLLLPFLSNWSRVLHVLVYRGFLVLLCCVFARQ